MITAIENYILRRIYIRIQRLTSQNQRDQYAIRGDPDAGLRGAITSIADDNIQTNTLQGEKTLLSIYTKTLLIIYTKTLQGEKTREIRGS